MTNWRFLERRAGAPAGAAVKADGYGLGAVEVVKSLHAAGCRHFFVSTWWEASQLSAMDLDVCVLHGFGPDDREHIGHSGARPVLNTPEQVARWKDVAPNQSCDVMIDTGMNRLGLRPEQAGVLEGLKIDTLHSHLACADENHPLNQLQLARFCAAVQTIKAERCSLANSAGVMLGTEYSFDLVRPGLALYGGVPRPEARGHIQQVAHLEAQVIQRRVIRAGETCGYSATFKADQNTETAIINIGYADGYWRGFSARGSASADGVTLPVLGRVSMDLVTLDCSKLPELAEGDWVMLDFELESAAAASGKSQYELLTGLGDRFERDWR